MLGNLNHSVPHNVWLHLTLELWYSSAHHVGAGTYLLYKLYIHGEKGEKWVMYCGLSVYRNIERNQPLG